MTTSADPLWETANLVPALRVVHATWLRKDLRLVQLLGYIWGIVIYTEYQSAEARWEELDHVPELDPALGPVENTEILLSLDTYALLACFSDALVAEAAIGDLEARLGPGLPSLKA